MAINEKAKLTGKKITFSRFINILLLIILVVVIAFGWWYLKGRSPVETVQSVINPGLPKPEYLFTIYGPDDRPLTRPLSTYVNDGRIYIADTDNSRVMVYDYNGKLLFKFGKRGKHVGAMVHPAAVLVVNNEIYVADITQGIVMVHDMEGHFKRILGNLKFVKPVSIAYSNNRFYVLDTGNMTVQILDGNGKLIKYFGKQGDKQGQFYCPDGIAVRDNKVYVADSNNNRIQIFDLDGNFLEEWRGKDARGEGGYSIPRGIAFDSKGNLYTAEMLNNSVSFTDDKGVRLAGISYAEPEKDGVEDSLFVPTSVFIDSERLYVTEMGKSRVIVYQIK